jgi:phosphoribosyl-AMP cyclohydrolase / phosphoribosyl-ATP pyrophosphohydrolase
MTPEKIEGLDWDKGNGLLPVIVQDAGTGVVLMTGYVNRDALIAMHERQEVVLWSRSRQCLWLKGETSGNRITVERIVADCDRDAILVLGRPYGPTCHTGSTSCFSQDEPGFSSLGFLTALERIIEDRLQHPRPESYTAELAAGGTRRIAQKVGEEGLEVALAASAPEDELVSESADLLFHLIVLLKTRNLGLKEVTSALESRHSARHSPDHAAPTAPESSQTLHQTR